VRLAGPEAFAPETAPTWVIISHILAPLRAILIQESPSFQGVTEKKDGIDFAMVFYRTIRKIL
jgi:hypothetical protein